MQNMKRRFFVTVWEASKPEVGAFILMKRWWSRRLLEIRYRPPGSDLTYEVPMDLFDTVVAAGSSLEIMAHLRQHQKELCSDGID